MKKTKISLWLLITIPIVVLIIITITLLFLFKPKENLVISPTTFTSSDASISITVPNEFNFTQIEDDSYILYLNSETSSTSIHISTTSTFNIRDIMKFISSDKDIFLSNFSSINNVSDIIQSEIQGLTCYNYHFNYQENKYVDVYWILNNSNFYVIDFNTNTQNQDFTPHISEVLNSLKFN